VKEDEFPPSDAIRDILPDYAMTDSDLRIGAAPGRLVGGATMFNYLMTLLFLQGRKNYI